MADSELTTPAIVRRKLGDYTDSTLTDYAIQEFINGAAAWIEASTGETYTSLHPRWQLARNCCTYRAAYDCVIRPAGGISEGLDYSIDKFSVKKSEQQKSMKETAHNFEKAANLMLSALKSESSDVPFSNTGSFG